jgi:hypothetical protein
MALDSARDLLYVSNDIAILVFANASTANGNVGPALTPATASTGNFSSLYIDTINDRLYVGEDSIGVKVYDKASTLNLATPDRTLTGNFGTGFSVRSIAVDVSQDILYVAVTTTAPSPSILAFNGAAAIGGSHTPDRALTLTFAASAPDVSILLDAANNRLYVSDPGGSITVLDNASTQPTGTAVVARSIDPGVGAIMTKLALDEANDRLYVAAQSSLIIVPNASSASGAAAHTALAAPMSGVLTAVAVKP